MQQTTKVNAMEQLKEVARRAVERTDPLAGFFEDLSLMGDAFPKSSVLELIDEADAVYWEVRPGVEYVPEMLIIECGEWRGRFDVPLPKQSV